MMPSRRVSDLLALVRAGFLLLGLAPAALWAGPLPRLAVSCPPGTDLIEAVRAVQTAGVREFDVMLPPVTARVGGNTLEADSQIADLQGLDLPAGIESVVHLVIELGQVPGEGRVRETAIARQIASALGRLALDRSPARGLLLDVRSTSPDADLLQFVVATVAVEARALKPKIEIHLILTPDMLVAPVEVFRRLGAYADAFVVNGEWLARESGDRLAERAAGKPLTARLSGLDSASSTAGAQAFVDVLLATPRLPEVVWIEIPAVDTARALARTVRLLTDALAGGFEAAGLERAPLAAVVNDQPVAEGLAFVSGQSAHVHLLIRAGGSPAAARELRLRGATGETQQLECFDVLSARRLPGTSDSRGSPQCSANGEYVLLSVRRASGDQRLFEAVDVRGRAELRVEEVIARWQASREADRRLLENHSVPCLLTLHFEASSFGMSLDVSLDLRQFVDRSGVNEWVQTGLLVNGVRFRKGQQFPLPLLEPEKVMTQPLELSLDQKYVYRLLGTETVSGALCYVIAIEPAVPTELLYAGRVWIDGLTFRQVRMRLDQRAGDHNVSSHVETQDFGIAHDAAGRAFTVFERIFVEESLNVAGRPVTLEKIYRFGEYTINGTDFQAQLAAARASDSPMFGDTPEGLRTLRREGSQRVLEPAPGKRIQSLVGGTIYDGSVDFPLPLAGLSWVDFDFRGTGSQLSAVFAGLFLAGNLSKQVRPTFRASGELALSALPTTDRMFHGDTEAKDQRFRSFEQSAGGTASWQLASAWTFTVSPHVAAVLYQRTGDTDPTFTVPRSGLIVRAWAELKYARRSLEASALVEQSVRVAGFGRYGPAGALQTARRSYTKYWTEIHQHVYTGKLARGGVLVSYFGGTNLDRLSRHHTSFLSKPRIVGVPAGVESFDAIGIAGVYYGFNVLDLAKLQGTYNHAWARNLDESHRFRQFDGLNLDLGLGGPWGTYVQGSVGFTVRGSLARYPSRWSLMLLVYKPISR